LRQNIGLTQPENTNYLLHSLGTCEASRFDSIRKRWADSKICESAMPAYCSS